MIVGYEITYFYDDPNGWQHYQLLRYLMPCTVSPANKATYSISLSSWKIVGAVLAELRVAIIFLSWYCIAKTISAGRSRVLQCVLFVFFSILFSGDVEINLGSRVRQKIISTSLRSKYFDHSHQVIIG